MNSGFIECRCFSTGKASDHPVKRGHIADRTTASAAHQARTEYGLNLAARESRVQLVPSHRWSGRARGMDINFIRRLKAYIWHCS